MIEISNYEHANYDPEEMFGYLTYYYPYNQALNTLVSNNYMESWIVSFIIISFLFDPVMDSCVSNTSFPTH